MIDPTSQLPGKPRHNSLPLALEFVWLSAGLLVFFAINLATAERIPTVWSDEVMYADPAVNLYQGHGFVSGSWFLQPMDKFWAGNVPLYQIALFGWLKLFGFGVVTVRSLHYALFAAAVLVVWLAIIRLDLIRSPAHRLLFCLIACLSSSSYFAFRFVRPESLGALLIACALLSFSCRPRWLALLLVLVIGMLLVSTGLQLAAYACLLGGLVWFWVPRRFHLEILMLFVGCALGIFCLYLLYQHHGVWDDFVVCIRHHTIANQGTSFANTTPYGASFREKIKHLPPIYFDYSFVPMLILAFWLSWKQFRAGSIRWKSPLACGILACLAIPAGLYAIGIFPIYYFWMAFMPLALGVCAELACLPGGSRQRLDGKLAMLLLVLVCLLGLPRRLMVATRDWQGRSYRPVMELAAPFVSGEKLIVCDFAAYYAAKQFSADVILPPYTPRMSESEKARVSVFIGRNGDTDSLARRFGGVWQDTGAALNPPMVPPVAGFRENLDSRQYDLRVFVRATPAL